MPVYAGDSMENIYQSVKDAVEAMNEPVQVHKMYLTHRRNGKKLVDFALGIAIVGNSGPVVVSSLRSDEADAALSLNAAAINAWGCPMPSDELPLSSLETQTSVQDDYLQHVEILPQYIRAYNSRLTMANLSIRHTGYTLSHVIVPGKTAYRVAWVLYYLRTAEGESIVKTAFPNDKTLWDTCLNYLYYPDSRCYKAVVGVAGKKGDVVRYLSFDMEGSSGLNGAVAIEKMPYNEIVLVSTTDGSGNTTYSYSLNAHYQGEVNGHQTAMSEEYVECANCRYVGAKDEAGTACPVCGTTLPTTILAGKGFSVPAGVNTFVEHQRNVVMVTYTQNPWNWSAGGVSEIGSGTVVALCPNTMAIEQEQFGKNPLYAFTSDEGVWGLAVGADGQLVAAQPATRDILLDPGSLLQTDGAILFATRRGVMMLTGRSCTLLSEPLESDDTSGTVSLSSLPGWEQIVAATGFEESELPAAGEDIRTFVQGCRMAYDYLNGRIVVYRPDKAYAYVYSLKSKQWGMMLSYGVCRSLNSYPDALCATNEGEIVSLSGDNSANSANSANQANQGTAKSASANLGTDSGLTVQGLVVTRPLKVSDYDVMKTVYKVFERGKIRPGHIQQALWGSRDLWHWNLVGSSTREFLTGMAGSPYTYFRIALWGKMAQDEIIHRITLDYREKYVGRQRANNEAGE